MFLKNDLYEGVLGNIIPMADHPEEVGNCFQKVATVNFFIQKFKW